MSEEKVSFIKEFELTRKVPRDVVVLFGEIIDYLTDFETKGYNYYEFGRFVVPLFFKYDNNKYDERRISLHSSYDIRQEAEALNAILMDYNIIDHDTLKIYRLSDGTYLATITVKTDDGLYKPGSKSVYDFLWHNNDEDKFRLFTYSYKIASEIYNIMRQSLC